MSRRNFLKAAGGSLAGVVAVGAVARLMPPAAGRRVNAAAPGHASASRWRYVVDTSKCIGCGACVRACKLENDVPPEPIYFRTWVERYFITEDDAVHIDSPDGGAEGFTADHLNLKYRNLEVNKSFFVPKLCNHCDNPPCLQVCPVGATYTSDDGVVLVNRKSCIGCRYCIQACPYGARFLDPRLKVVDKCTWCYHRITRGMRPACVEVCPVGARTFGDITDRDDATARLIRENRVNILKPDLGTAPKVYYIGLQKEVT